jgi:phosphoglycerate dehydrogenase-like enzyme
VHAVVVDRSTLYCLGESTDPVAISTALSGYGVRVATALPGQSLVRKMVALAAHDLTAAELSGVRGATQGSWVHLVSSGFGYPDVAELARHNLVTRSARAYAAALSEYVITQHVLHCARDSGDGETTKPFNRRAAVVVGFGAFGRTVAATLNGLGMRVMVIRARSRSVESFGSRTAAGPLAELPDGLTDLLVVALPEMTEFVGFVSDDIFRCVRPDGHVVNPARSSPMDYAALAHWLTTGAGRFTSDVETDATTGLLRPWIDRGRVTVTPHIAWRPWDGDPLYHRDWMSIYTTGDSDRTEDGPRLIRMGAAAIDTDFLLPRQQNPTEPLCPCGCWPSPSPYSSSTPTTT